jgi:hypothetical protein
MRKVTAVGSTRQYGSVLIVSLLMLLIMTLLGVTALSMVTLEERMARGFQHGEVTFQMAQTATNESISRATPEITVNGISLPNPNYVEADDQVLGALGGSAVCDSSVAKNYDKTVGKLTTTNPVKYTYRGEKKNIPGFSLGVGVGFVGHVFHANAVSTVGSTGIQANHDQGVMVVMRGTDTCLFQGIPAPPASQ